MTRASESEDEDLINLPTAPTEDVQFILAGHNAIKFDFPLLLAECCRHNLDTDCFDRWSYVDTMHILQDGHACCKLQCLVKGLFQPEDLRAHRALDDCVALRKVVESVAQRLGVRLRFLFESFAVGVDTASSLAQLRVLMEEI